MVIDLNLLRKDRGGNPEIVLKSERDRFRGTERVDSILKYDEKWRELRYKLDTLNKHKNTCSKECAKKAKNKNNDSSRDGPIIADPLLITAELLEALSISQIKDLSKSIDAHVEEINFKLKQTEDARDSLLSEVGNILHHTVPIDNDENNNRVERLVGDYTKNGEHSHVDLLLMIDGADYKRGVAVAGNRGYYLKGPAVFLAHALVDFSLKLLYNKNFTPLYTPFFMKKNLMKSVAQLSQFDDELYKVGSKSEKPEENTTGNEDEKYLIATSEQTIAAFHKDEWLSPEILPLKYAGVSTCFRQEVGSHGRDTTGIFRVHQFEKVEQFVLCSPLEEESWKHLELMMANAEELCKALGFGYRVVSIVSGALNNAAAKKLDLEAWFPGSCAFRELVSCSNCTDYQSRSLGIRFGCTKQLNKEVKFVHMLNCTMCAVTRYLCCMLETHQTAEGINVPECLHPYIPESLKFIPFTKTLAEVRKIQ